MNPRDTDPLYVPEPGDLPTHRPGYRVYVLGAGLANAFEIAAGHVADFRANHSLRRLGASVTCGRLALLFVKLNAGASERLIGHLLTETFRARMRRMGPDDAHEARHLMAALAAGNSDPCVGADCHLDRATLRRLHDANWPGSHRTAAFLDQGSA